jgi:hypothetical protein
MCFRLRLVLLHELYRSGLLLQHRRRRVLLLLLHHG